MNKHSSAMKMYLSHHAMAHIIMWVFLIDIKPQQSSFHNYEFSNKDHLLKGLNSLLNKF